jgi:hypothetical protein
LEADSQLDRTTLYTKKLRHAQAKGYFFLPLLVGPRDPGIFFAIRFRAPDFFFEINFRAPDFRIVLLAIGENSPLRRLGLTIGGQTGRSNTHEP